MFLLPRLGLLLPVVLLGPLQVVDSSFPRPAGGRCVGGDSDDASVETDSDDASVETDDSDATPVVSDEDERDPPSRPPMRERKFRSRNARPTSIGPRQQRGRTCWLCSWVTTLVAVVDECKAMGWQELHDRLWRVLDIPADGGKNGGRPEQAYWTALGVACTSGVPHDSQLCRCLKNSRMTWVPRTEVRGRVENLPECAHQPSWSWRGKPLLAWGAATGVEVVDSQGRELQNRNIWERKKPQKMVRSEEPSQSQQEPEPAGAPSLSWERARGFLARLIPFATIPEDRDGVTPSLSSGMVAKPERVRERLPLLIVFQPASWNRIVSSNPPAGWKRSPEFQNASLEDVGAHELVLACQYTLKYRHTGIQRVLRSSKFGVRLMLQQLHTTYTHRYHVLRIKHVVLM